jgi:glycosyltransferase involved in cell wall biosynthesis
VISARHLDDRAVLVFLGNPSAYSENVLKGIVREYGLEEKVFFRNAVDSRMLVHYISSADIGVVIYKNSCRNNYLCAPNKMFDYCMAGLPSIGCDFPPIRRIADSFGVVRLFDPDDPESIADAGNGFIRDPAIYRAAKNATAMVAREFTWEREEKKLIALYSPRAGMR